MNRRTGGALNKLEHIAQSIEDILTTRHGTRLERRDYGSLLPELIDQPLNPATHLRLYAATAIALMRWEPRISLAQVVLVVDDLSGSAELSLTGVIVDTHEPFNIRTPLQLGGSA
ncbi:GPW/gp25 family protein [Pseudomonas monteilii]|uniref:GPW/gp25 family protein n=1 Tax=Pseudomonas monteilii TaxID=76759 RepID=UPI00383B1916